MDDETIAEIRKVLGKTKPNPEIIMAILAANKGGLKQGMNCAAGVVQQTVADAIAEADKIGSSLLSKLID